ncbi:hypothetical protein B0H17DRAFT_937813 [Mycena rosella]|uniref:Reverse transcriptase zinc-binding domain-containing protein n=1 Tax=Mycena rosella TaxID=1033263 RepID=A0AAD7DDK7_MYCRO|nr:hypothetical protein B0H17DRAFT_937813 [Mycena rosella]
MPRKHAVILLQLRVGHTILNKHLHRMKHADSPSCPCCHREDNTVIHYLLHCPAHANTCTKMHRIGGRDSRVLEKLLSHPKLLPPLFQFITGSGCYRTVFSEIPELPLIETQTRCKRLTELNANELPVGLVPPQIPRNIGLDWVPPVGFRFSFSLPSSLLHTPRPTLTLNPVLHYTLTLAHHLFT